eukprot:COSAG05_NODE_2_length_63105_cov_159.292956_9_plen_143_part_00
MSRSNGRDRGLSSVRRQAQGAHVWPCPRPAKTAPYGFFRGAVGMSTLWNSFNENNERQKACLEDDNKSAWVPWRTLQKYVAEQSTNQLMWDAKAPTPSLTIIPTPDNNNLLFQKPKPPSESRVPYTYPIIGAVRQAYGTLLY